MTDRRPHDNYPTPDWCTRELLTWLDHSGVISVGDSVQGWVPYKCIDPFAGAGSILTTVIDVLPYSRATGVDIADKTPIRGVTWHTGDAVEYLYHQAAGTMSQVCEYDLCVTNPPYGGDVWECALPLLLRRCCITCALMRQSWYGAGCRAEMRREAPATYLLRPSHRPSFGRKVKCKKCGISAWYATDATWPRECDMCGGKTACSTTDGAEYEWVVWVYAPAHNDTTVYDLPRATDG